MAVHNPAQPKPAQEVAEAQISVPLYVAALVAMIAGIQSASNVLPDTSVGTVASLLAVLGFAFSYMCRWLKVPQAVIYTACGGLIAYLIYGGISGTLDVDWFFGGLSTLDTTMAACLMWASVIFCWVLLSDQLVLFCCLWSAAMVGLSGAQDVDNDLLYFAIYLLSMLFLIVHRNAMTTTRKKTSAAGGVNGVVGQFGVAAVSMALILCMAAVVAVPMSLLVGRTQIAGALRQFAATAGPAAALQGTSFQDGPTFDTSEAGDVWSDSATEVMHVVTSDGQPHYWRGRTYDSYTGTGWTSTLSAPELLTQQPGSDTYAIPPTEGETPGSPALRDRPIVKATFEMEGALTPEFYYGDQPLLLEYDSGGDGPRFSADGRLDLGGGTVHSSYTVTFRAAPEIGDPGVADRLRHDGDDYPPEIRLAYLGDIIGPANSVTTLDDKRYFDSVVSSVIGNLPPDHRTPFDKAAALRDWIAATCTYSLAVPAMPDNVDNVHEFLAESRIGYCDQFASSLAVLCRVAGIPARVVTGFAQGDPDSTGFKIRSMDKHAWTEIYFPGDEWIPFDATVGTKDASTTTSNTSDYDPWKRIRTELLSHSGLPMALLVVGLALGLYVGFRELQPLLLRMLPAFAAARSTPSPSSATGLQYQKMCRALGRLGLPRRVSETPNEYAARIGPRVDTLARELSVSLSSAVVADMTARFVSGRYANGSPAPAGAEFAAFLRATIDARRRLFLRKLQRGGRGVSPAAT